MGLYAVVLDLLRASCEILVHSAWLSCCVRHRCEPRVFGRTAYSCSKDTLSLKHLRRQIIFHLPATLSPRRDSTDPRLRAYINALLPPPPALPKRLIHHAEILSSLSPVGTLSLMLLRRQLVLLQAIRHPPISTTHLFTIDIHTMIATSIASRRTSTVSNVWRLRRPPPTIAPLAVV